MPRKSLIRQNVFPYSLTARSNNKDWFTTPLSVCWRIFEDEIEQTSERYGIDTHCFVLMSNHFHWLVTTPNENLDEAMRYFMTETSRKIARASGRINKIYGARYKPSLITDPGYYANTIRYFYQNPIRAGISARVDDYPWSTRSLHSRIELKSCAALEAYIPSEPRELRTWLNTIPEGPYQLMMQRALRRPEFKFPVHPTKKRPLSANSFLSETVECI